MGTHSCGWFSLLLLLLNITGAISTCTTEDPCLNGGTCSGGACTCMGDYVGSFCEGICPAGWTYALTVPGACYLYVTTNANFEVAGSSCAAQGALLSTIRNAAELAVLRGLTSQTIWIGLHFVDHDADTATWVDGSPWTSYSSSLWNDNEPNNAGTEYCGEMASDGGVNDKNCATTNLHYICRSDIDECDGVTCQQGGTCSTPTVGDFTCTCPAGYSGKTCGVDINECAATPCDNLGTCVDGINSFSCTCAAGWTGDTCTMDIDECAMGGPCLHEGLCSAPVFADFECDCMPGYTGKICDVDIDDCASTPCMNEATCVDGVNTHACNCKSGFVGIDCSININDCTASPCANDGLCVDGDDKVTCVCQPGFSGDYCQFDANECASSPCFNDAACIDEANSYRCVCQPGYDGTKCQNNINECFPNPCENQGVCTDGINSYTCECADGYTGPTCQENVDDCLPNSCANGGICVDNIDFYTCDCAPGFTGFTCQTNIDECASRPCLNGGSCFDGDNAYQCVCVSGYSGLRCGTDPVDCNNDPCQNGGTCELDGEGSYTCTCRDTYSGRNCEVSAAPDIVLPLAISGGVFALLLTATCIGFIYYNSIRTPPSFPVQPPLRPLGFPGQPSVGLPPRGLPRDYGNWRTPSFRQPPARFDKPFMPQNNYQYL